MDSVYVSPNGVVYDIHNSPYIVHRNGLIFKFSSARHMDKFMMEVRIREEWLNDSLSRRFKVQVELSILADFQLYQQIERRGFHVEDEEGSVYVCREQVLLDGLMTRLNDSKKQSMLLTE